MWRKYTTKPFSIEAILWDGENIDEIKEAAGSDFAGHDETAGELKITTLEGVMTASRGDYIIKGMRGEFYPCKPDVFKAKYEEVI